MDSAVEMIGVSEGLMREEVAFQIAPGPLDVVQLRGIFRQPFDGEPISGGQSGARGFAGMDGTVIEHQDDRFVLPGRVLPVARGKGAEEGDEIAAALGGAGIDDQLAGGAIKGADHRPLARLPRRLDAQIAAAFGPGAGKIGMGECLRFIAEQQGDVAGLGLLLQQAQAQTRAVDRIAILPALQRVARPAPGKAPFFSTTLSRDFEMRSPVRFSISSVRRGSVQFGRSDTPVVSSSSITDKATRALTGAGRVPCGRPDPRRPRGRRPSANGARSRPGPKTPPRSARWSSRPAPAGWLLPAPLPPLPPVWPA